MTRHYFPLLSVNFLSVKAVLHPEEIWGHQFQVGVLCGRALVRVKGAKPPKLSKYKTNNTYSGLKCILFVLNLEIFKKILS